MSRLLLYACLLGVLLKDVGMHKYHQRGYKICSAYGHTLLDAMFGNESHLLCLKLRTIGSSTVISHLAALILDPEPIESQNMIQGLPLDNITMAYGYPIEDSSSGSAEGYIGDDHHFYGVLHLRNRTLHADPYGKDDPTRWFGAFENDYMPAPARVRRYNAQEDKYAEPFKFRIEPRKTVPGVARARICDLLLLADKEFFEKDANSSLNHVVRRMVHAVAQADIIFRNADFNEDGVPDNIGFSVKYILVLTSNETNTRVFGDLLNKKTVDGPQYLMRFARLRRLSEVCLGVAFSGHAFRNRTLGLSFTSLGGGVGGAAGGLCDRRAYGRSFNTLAIAHATTVDEERVPERIAALTLSHEMGHSFGAHHDDNFPNPECRGYLMGSQSSTTDSSRVFEFSICSKRLIASTLHSMSYCLKEEDSPYCGNGIVERGEACDCGMPSRCSRADPCCTPRAGGALVYEEGTLHKEGCSVAPLALCHPSQGLCCTPNCEFADLTRNGIDCSTQMDECTCTVKDTKCRCGLGGRCLEDGSCHAAECALLGMRECQCSQKGVGGKLGIERMCGICCLLVSTNDPEGRCVGAEFAAQALLDNGYILPLEWPEKNYHGQRKKKRAPTGEALVVSLDMSKALGRLGSVYRTASLPVPDSRFPEAQVIMANVTMNLCNNDYVCATAVLRAWPVNDPCISLNTVGICSITGSCMAGISMPKSNVFPNTMSIKLMPSNNESSSTRTTSTSLNLLLFVLVAVVK